MNTPLIDIFNDRSRRRIDRGRHPRGPRRTWASGGLLRPPPDWRPADRRHLADNYLKREFQHWHLLPLDVDLDAIPLADAEVSGLVNLDLGQAVELTGGTANSASARFASCSGSGRSYSDCTLTDQSLCRTTSGSISFTCVSSLLPAGTAPVYDGISTGRQDAIARSRTQQLVGAATVTFAGVERVHEAERLAKRLVGSSRRWVHVRAVAERAAELTPAVDPDDAELLVAAAWVHDIGYASEIARTGFHPLDGARFLRAEGWPGALVNLVAHHSGARFEAVERGLSAELAEFPFEESPLSDALAASDLTAGPNGERMTFDERIDEVLRRYPPEHPVNRAWQAGRDTVKVAVLRAQRRLGQAQSTTG